jgi:hypothetical protein
MLIVHPPALPQDMETDMIDTVQEMLPDMVFITMWAGYAYIGILLVGRQVRKALGR